MVVEVLFDVSKILSLLPFFLFDIFQYFFYFGSKYFNNKKLSFQ